MSIPQNPWFKVPPESNNGKAVLQHETLLIIEEQAEKEETEGLLTHAAMFNIQTAFLWQLFKPQPAQMFWLC